MSANTNASEAEQLEAHIRDFWKMWALQFAKQTAHLKPDEIADLMQQAWVGWKKRK